jgi:hypothetical protein
MPTLEHCGQDCVAAQRIGALYTKGLFRMHQGAIPKPGKNRKDGSGPLRLIQFKRPQEVLQRAQLNREVQI